MKPTLNAPAPTISAWNMLHRADQPLCIADIALPALASTVAAEKGAGLDEVIGAIDEWRTCRLIERVPGKYESYVMTEEGRELGDQVEQAPMARKYGRSGRARMWTAIRVLKKFGIKELTSAAEVHERTALNYLRLLERAGYVAATGHRNWKVVRHTGPYHPGQIYQSNSKTVVALEDRNTGKRYPVSPRQRAQRAPLFFSREP